MIMYQLDIIEIGQKYQSLIVNCENRLAFLFRMFISLNFKLIY